MEMILHGNKVLNVKFYDDTFVRTHGRNLFTTSRIDHVGYVEEIVARGLEVYSVIILCEPLDSRLWKDSKYASGTTHLLKSQLEQDALDLMKYNDYYSDDEIQNLVTEYDLMVNIGGSGGSSTREAQGLWAHVFALLQTKHRNVERSRTY
jgi:hypothetical protein